jgi:hypothetical protein
MYKPYDTEGHSFWVMSHGNMCVLHCDSVGLSTEMSLVAEDIPLLIELLQDTKKLMEWQENKYPTKETRTLKKRPPPLFCTKCGKKGEPHY